MKLLIAGDDTFDDVNLFKERCDALLVNSTDIEIVFTGDTALDTLAAIYALAEDYPVMQFKSLADAVQYSDASIIFWNSEQDTPMADLIEIAKDMKYRIVRY